MNKKAVWTIIIATIAAILGILAGNILTKRAVKRDSISQPALNFLNIKYNKLTELMNLIDYDYVDNVNSDSIANEAMGEIVSKLDPHSVYIPQKDMEEVKNELEGSFSGIGVQFEVQNDTISIVNVIQDGPSEKVGILQGDRIVAVNDTAFVGKNKLFPNSKILKKLRGKKGSKIKVGIKRNGTKDIISYNITRGDIPIKSILASYIIAPQIGYIGLNNNFGNKTYNEFIDNVAKLKNEGAEKFIIDLRGNSGGLLSIAINMINEFLPEGEMIVYSEGKNSPKSDAYADGTGSCINNPIVVLIDEFSASASEIFAGAIQDNDRGIIIGRRSFGKGLVQSQIPFSDGSAVRLTIARYYTPSGRCIQKPYIKGKAIDYEMDIVKRFEHGEFYHKDSIHITDTVKYKTLKGRTVYAGGGIMPDIFIPRDTSNYSPYYTKVINKGYLRDMAFNYVDKNRAKLAKYKSWQELNSFLKAEITLNKIVEYTKSKGVSPNGSDLKVSGESLTDILRSYIVRNSINNESFIEMINSKDETVKRAVKELEN